MSMSRITEKKMNLKLLIDKKGKKVMFAEVEKEFVDFIFHIMSLPVSSLTRLLTEKQMVGCLGDLYKTIDDSLNNLYFDQSNCRKDAVLKPQYFSPFVPLLCNTPNNTANSQKDKNHSANFEGFVKEVKTYMVMDSLEVKPMSMSTVMSLNIHIGSLEERQVQFGLLEGIAMLEASMKTKNVLTAVFLERQSHLSVGYFGWLALTATLVGAFIFTVASNIFGGSFDDFKPT